VQFSELQKLSDLPHLDHGSGQSQTGAHIQSRSTEYPHTKLDRNQNNFLWTDRRTDVRTYVLRTDGQTWVTIY